MPPSRRELPQGNVWKHPFSAQNTERERLWRHDISESQPNVSAGHGTYPARSANTHKCVPRDFKAIKRLQNKRVPERSNRIYKPVSVIQRI